jgi:hypothetical protein
MVAMRIAGSFAALAALGLAAPACDRARAQTRREAMALVCDVEARANISETDPAERTRLIAEFLDRRVTHPDVRRLLHALAASNRDVVRDVLLAEAREVGLPDCKAAHLAAP